MEHRGTGWHASRVRVTRPDTTGGARADGRTDRRPLVQAVRAVVPGTPPDRGRRAGARPPGLDATRHVLVVAVHPIVCDAPSLALVWRDLGRAYFRAVAGIAPLLPVSRPGQADPVAWLADPATVDVDGWQARLAGVSGVLDLPRDPDRPPVRAHATDTAARSVPGRRHPAG